MTDILFIYSKLNPDLGYRQGMHELLAPILWVVDRDAADTGPLGEGGSTDEDDNDNDMLQLLDAAYIEHDSFSLFCSVMQTVRVYYEHSEQRSASGQMDVIPIVARCQYVHDELLTTADSELADHLQTQDILPQIFLTWVECLLYLVQKLYANRTQVVGCACSSVGNSHLRKISLFGILSSLKDYEPNSLTSYALLCCYEFDGNVSHSSLFHLSTVPFADVCL